MKDNIFDFQSEVCKAFASPRRLQILNLVKTNEQAVGDIANAMGISKANVSQHLAIMRIRGLLKTRRVGTVVYYRIANEKLAHACNLMQDALGQIMESDLERRKEHEKQRKEYSIQL